MKNPLVSLRRLALLYELPLEWRILRPPTEADDPTVPDVIHVDFRSTEVKNGMMLRGAYGSGETQAEAADDYLKQIAGETLVVNAYGDNRREIKVPGLGVILT